MVLPARVASPEVWLKLSERLTAYRAHPEESAFGDLPEAAQVGAFPVLYNIGSFFLLRPDGALFVVGDGPNDGTEVPEGPERWPVLSLAAGNTAVFGGACGTLGWLHPSLAKPDSVRVR